MLEIKNLTKIYKSKGGVQVKALNDISVKFPETGMVFLLGKSGSGKSTLLNVCGGLDNPTSGEVIIKGKSSKNFTQSDFDSYRNTFVGFIFQEYNILNEFTVEENIALALELQGKSKDKKAINDLLDKVDLAGYGKRKPNTLSGGQKQRIAIARALIKSPEIIMADEPTGALDSVTGKQVFDTLKKLSKDTLVMVVSHDREFAETYADRIIELKDGIILSDISKTSEKEESITSNVSVIGDTLCIKKGTDLTDKDFLSIKKFLNDSSNGVIIAKNEDDVKKIKNVTKINANGEKEVFKDTLDNDIKLKEYKKEDSKFIRSKLPLKHAFKIGASSLKNKPVRLFFTIMLCTVAFILFGLFSTLTFYDSGATFKETLSNSSYSFIKLNNKYLINEKYYQDGEIIEGYDYYDYGTFTDADLNNYNSEYGKEVFGTVNVDWAFIVQNSSSAYWTNKINSVGYLKPDNPLRNSIVGTYPKENNEIVISSYTAKAIINNKSYDADTNKLIDINNVEDIIGKKLSINGQSYKITGVFDSGEIDSKYESLLNSKDDNRLIMEYDNYLLDELHLVAYATEEKVSELSDTFDYSWVIGDFNGKTITTSLKNNGVYDFGTWTNALYGEYSKYSEDVIKIQDFQKLSNKEVVVSRSLFADAVINYYNSNGLWSEDLELAYEVQSGYKQVYNKDKNIYESAPLSISERDSKTKELINKIKGINLTIGIKLFDEYVGNVTGDLMEVNIAGVKLDNSNQVKVLFNDKYAQELWAKQLESISDVFIPSTNYKKTGIYGTIYLPFNKSDVEIDSLYEIYTNEKLDDNYSKASIASNIIVELEMVDMMIKEMSKLFLYAGIALAVFAVLLFFNFISVSISYKTKEIGILRAVGARSNDVFKIFFSESLVITIICIILATIGSVVICNLLNNGIANSINVSIFVFGFMSFIVLILIAFVTAFISTFLPVYKAARKKPVDSIRSL
ncbi:MAG: ATP-binding cassette domain-containing protein [Firmicutes bacterium]|nr:ATP-binding cassette domain-containing protein [Bacillota bacterium]